MLDGIPHATFGSHFIVCKYQGGFVHLPGGEKFEYLLAEFGVRVPTGELELDGFPNPSSTWALKSKMDTIIVARHFVSSTKTIVVV